MTLVLMEDLILERFSQGVQAFFVKPLQPNPGAGQGANARHHFTAADQQEGEATVPTLDSFHLTWTMTSSTMNSTAEKTEEGEGRPRNFRLFRVSGAETGEAVNERAFQAELKVFRSCDSLLTISIAEFLGRQRDRCHIGEAKLPTSHSFHLTSTMTSRTMHSSEESTGEVAGRHRDFRLCCVPGTESDEAVIKRAYQSDLRKFRSCDSLRSIAGCSFHLGRH